LCWNRLISSLFFKCKKLCGISLVRLLIERSSDFKLIRHLITNVLMPTISNNKIVSWNQKIFRFNYKIMIRVFKNYHLVLWFLKNIMVCESLGKRISYVKKRHIILVHLMYSKLYCWLTVNLRHVCIYWFHLRFKIDFSSWESLYFIGLNPNHSKAYFLAKHLFSIFISIIPGDILYIVILYPQILKFTTKS
jgi:hypothetical protein